MEYEFQEPRRRGRAILAAGITLAVVTGVGAYILLSQSQGQGGTGGVRVPIVVAKVDIPARRAITADDVVVREVPIDETNASGVFSDPARVVGLIAGTAILKGQPIFANMLAGGSQAGPFSILGPNETVAPNSEAWRAVSVTVPDDRAVGGLLVAGQEVDIFVSATITIPASLAEQGRYYTDKSTKIVYQDVVILTRAASFYVIKVTLPVAEEINHLQASGAAAFSLALRPPQDLRVVDAGRLGATTNVIITKYGLPIPETYPAGVPVATFAPPSPTVAPADSPAPSGSPSSGGQDGG
jgi:Flp pilus assembly protein CpaB